MPIIAQEQAKQAERAALIAAKKLRREKQEARDIARRDRAEGLTAEAAARSESDSDSDSESD